MLQVWAAYSPVKNSPPDAKAKVAAGAPSHSATTGELDIYQTNCRCAACGKRGEITRHASTHHVSPMKGGGITVSDVSRSAEDAGCG